MPRESMQFYSFCNSSFCRSNAVTAIGKNLLVTIWEKKKKKEWGIRREERYVHEEQLKVKVSKDKS